MKQTEIGLIPDDWEVKRLGEISNGFSYGVGAEAVAFNGIDRYIRITDIDDATNRFVPNPLCSPKFYSSADIVQENDILFARTGASVGKTYIYDKKDGRLIFAGFLMKVHVIDEDGKFIFYQTLTDKYKSWVISESMRTGQPGLNLEQIKNFSIPLPPLPEQQRISEALSDVDALISTTEKLIQKKKNIKQGAMQNLLTGKKRLPGFAKSNNTKMTELGEIPEDWEVKKLNKECIIKARIGWQGLKSEEYLDSGDYVLITGTDFNNGFINWKSCNYVSEWRFKQDKNIQIKQGDVLITKDGTIGKIAFLNKIPMQGTLNSGVFVVRPKNNQQINPIFLSLVFKSFWFDNFLEQITSGSTIVHLYQKDFLKFNFPLPPKEEQNSIAKILSDMDNEIDLLNKKLEKYRNLKTAMMQQLLTGKIRLG